MIELRRVSKTFNRGTANEIHALKELNLSIRSSEFVVVVGSNGSGKSSLLNILAGSIRPDSGTLTIDSNDVTRLAEHERSKWISRVFQNPLTGTASDLTILENFRLAALRTQPKKFKIGTGEAFQKKIRDKISLLNLGLENKLQQPMGTLSGGQRQALTLLMATLDDTRVLLMDEPAAALDPKTADLLMNFASQLIRESGLTTVLVTHQLKDALHYGDRMLLMKDGSISKDIPSKEKSRLELSEIYEWF